VHLRDVIPGLTVSEVSSGARILRWAGLMMDEASWLLQSSLLLVIKMWIGVWAVAL
jgi:hypothetical protein